MRINLVFAAVLFSCSAFSQKNDYLWPLGMSPGYADFRFFFNFHDDPPSILLRDDNMSTGIFAAAYSNDAGQIQAYSNGLWILNKYGDVIENSKGLNPTLAANQTQGSYQGNDSGFFLANPGDSSILYLIHLDFGYHPLMTTGYTWVGRHLLVTTVDLKANNGAGKVTSKNVSLIDGVLMTATAVRHANGRDWWIMVTDADENRHYRFLLTPQGFEGPFTQEIGTKPSPLYIGNSVIGNSFSPSGRYYIDSNSFVGFSVFEFDRCSGLLSNERRVEWPEPVVPPYGPRYYGPGGGSVFSPDDRLLYMTVTYNFVPATPYGSIPYFFQMDLTASDLLASIDTINPIDPLKYYPNVLGYLDYMYSAELGPDGRIYIVSKDQYSYCSVQYPNVRGKGSGFRYKSPDFQDVIYKAMPVLPNYRLGPLDGSPCDTLGLNNIPVADFRADDSLNSLTRYFYDLSYKEPQTWSWDFGDGQTSTDTSSLHSYDQPGKYQVCLTVSNANGSNTFCRYVFVGITGQEEAPGEAAALRVFPNPADSYVQIGLPAVVGSPAVLRLQDAWGRIVREIAVENGQSSLRMPIAGLPAGFYTLVLQQVSGGTVLSAKLIVSH